MDIQKTTTNKQIFFYSFFAKFHHHFGHFRSSYCLQTAMLAFVVGFPTLRLTFAPPLPRTNYSQPPNPIQITFAHPNALGFAQPMHWGWGAPCMPLWRSIYMLANLPANLIGGPSGLPWVTSGHSPTRLLGGVALLVGASIQWEMVVLLGIHSGLQNQFVGARIWLIYRQTTWLTRFPSAPFPYRYSWITHCSLSIPHVY